MNLTKEIVALERLVNTSLSSQVWAGSKGSSDYFNETPQGDRFDDELYKKLGNYLRHDVKTVLDIGAGEGKLGQELVASGYKVTCIEPSFSRFQQMQTKGIESLNISFKDVDIDDVFDSCISLRSIGVSSKSGDFFYLFETLKKLLTISKHQLIIVTKAIEDKTYVSEEFQNLQIFNKVPWLYHYEMLKLMGKKPKLDYISLDVCKPYDSIEDCIEKDFPKETPLNRSKYLSKYTFINNEKLYRRTRLLFPVVDLHIEEKLR